jgi:hypothetical protein
MASNADNVAAGLQQVTALITLLTSSATPTVSINGESIDMSGYLANLRDTLPVLLATQQALQGPYQRVSKMRT